MRQIFQINKDLCQFRQRAVGTGYFERAVNGKIFSRQSSNNMLACYLVFVTREEDAIIHPHSGREVKVPCRGEVLCLTTKWGKEFHAATDSKLVAGKGARTGR